MSRQLRNLSRLGCAGLKILGLRLLLRPLARWRPLPDPVQGYSLVLACPAGMVDLLGANLLALDRQDRTHLDRIWIVFDQPLNPELALAQQRLRSQYPDLPLEFLHFGPWQARVLDGIRWGWAYAWLSWCLGLAACRTRYLVIHDLDLLTLAPDFLEKRYQAIRERGVPWLGMDRFTFNGFTPEDGLVPSNEMILDAALVRRRFAPIDLFNKVTWWHGRFVHFDLTLYAQSRAGPSAHLGYRVMEMVHPNQMICQFTALLHRPNYRPQPRTSLLLLPYYYLLAGNPAPLREVQQSLGAALSSRRASLLGHELDLTGLTAPHVRTLAEMARQVELAFYGGVRPEVSAYFRALEDFAGPARMRLAA